MAYLVRLKGNWPGNFRRSVRHDHDSGEQVLTGGDVVGVLDFSPGQEVTLSEEEYQAVAADIGLALEHIDLDEKNRPRPSDEPVEVDEELLSEVGATVPPVETKPPVQTPPVQPPPDEALEELSTSEVKTPVPAKVEKSEKPAAKA